MLNGRTSRVFWTLAVAHLINDSYVFFLPTLLPLLDPIARDLADGGRAGGWPVSGHVVGRRSRCWDTWQTDTRCAGWRG